MNDLQFGRLFTIGAVSLLVGFSCKNAVQAPPPRPAQPASHQKMLSFLAMGRKEVFNPNNYFSSEARLKYNDSLLVITKDPAERINIKFTKASVLLEYGDEAAAVALYEDIQQSMGKDIPPETRKILLSSLGLAYLRLGERTNCVSWHTADACIMPIRGNGIHQDKNGSRKAIETFQTLLTEDPGDLDARWLLNIAYMTVGEYPAQVPSQWLIPGLDAPSAVPVKPFADVAPGLKINVNNRAGGSITDDFDNDGYLDIITSAWGLDDPMHYMHNNGDGTFSDWSVSSGLDEITGGLNLTSADYNNDGWLDIYVLRGAWQGGGGSFGNQPKSLLRNNGDGTFTDVTLDAGLICARPTQTAVWADFNKDGWVDLYIGLESMQEPDVNPNELFLNNRNGTFTNVAPQWGVDVKAFVKGVAAGDYDNDGWPDIFISCLDGKKFLFHNKTGTGFEDVSDKSGFGKVNAPSFGTAFFDYDNDGWLDIYYCNYSYDKPLSYYSAREALHPSADRAGKVQVFRNNHNGTFTDVSERLGLNQVAFAMGNNIGDIDNDGYLDFYLGTGNPNYRSLMPNKMFKNMGGQKFVDVTTSARVGNLQKGHGVSFADLDNDGDQDIYIDMGGAYRGDYFPSTLYLNPGQNANHWICLKLEGVQSNKAAIGAKITLKFRENGQARQVYREVNTGGSFGCSPLRREIGVGQAEVIDEIAIQWPAGTTQVLKNIAPNQFIKIREGQEGMETVALKTLDFTKGSDIPMCVPPKLK